MKDLEQSKVWQLLNSKLFLWFLSAIIISSGSFFYTKWNENRQNILTIEKQIKKLDLEISSRLSFCAEQILAREKLKNVILVLENPEKSDFPAGVFTEFSRRSLRALLWELHSLVTPEEKEQINNASKTTKNFKKIYLATEEFPDFLDNLFNSNKKKNNYEKKKNKESAKGTTKIYLKEKEPNSFEEEKYINDSKSNSRYIAPPEKPITMQINVKIEQEIKVILERAIATTIVTFETFNIERWDKPFKDVFYKIRTSKSIIEIEGILPASKPIFKNR